MGTVVMREKGGIIGGTLTTLTTLTESPLEFLLRRFGTGIEATPESRPACDPVPSPATSTAVPDAPAGPQEEQKLPGPTVLDSGDTPSFLLVTDAAILQTVAIAVDNSSCVAVDLETTGLNPRTDRVRLLTVACDTVDGGSFAYLVDCFAVDPRPLWPHLADATLVIHHAQFDLGFLWQLGFRAGKVRDTEILSQLVHGIPQQKGFFRLKETLARELHVVISKDEQKSDWSKPVLTAEQIEYAAADVEHLRPLLQVLETKIAETGQQAVADLECRCQLGMVWLAAQGVPVDGAQVQAHAEAAVQAQANAQAKLDSLAAIPGDALPGCHRWNWDSHLQIKEAFALSGCPVESTADEALLDVEHPLVDALQAYRTAGKLASEATGVLEKIEGGRLYPDWRQMGARTGRMACARPNMQQCTKAGFRHVFAAPAGCVLVKADYSQIELRIACKVASERVMLEAYRQGQDIHRLTAQRITGKQEVTKEERQLSKPVNFGLIYGLGVPSLMKKAKGDYGVILTQADATRYHQAFFDSYPAIARWHNAIKRGRATETRTLTSRRVLVEADHFYGGKANYVIQGTGGDGIKLALALLWERRDQCPTAVPILVVHDELVLLVPEADADAAKAWLVAAMKDAMEPLIAPVPVEVDATIAPTWGG